jgi:hypothetical protein
VARPEDGRVASAEQASELSSRVSAQLPCAPPLVGLKWLPFQAVESRAAHRHHSIWILCTREHRRSLIILEVITSSRSFLTRLLVMWPLAASVWRLLIEDRTGCWVLWLFSNQPRTRERQATQHQQVRCNSQLVLNLPTACIRSRRPPHTSSKNKFLKLSFSTVLP